jgi:biopolymer transport protein ExbB/TolQ|tara:strand:+ start:1444 stop:2346 length:903 start_codon:yes stop_codon:yes gene_type:complete
MLSPNSSEEVSDSTTDQEASKILEWHVQDPEQRLGFSGGRYTAPNKMLAMIAALLLSAVFFALVILVLSGLSMFKYFSSIVLDRGPTQYLAILFFFWVLVMLWFKLRKLAFQQRAFSLPIMPSDSSFSLTPKTASHVLDRLHEYVDNPQHFAVLNRVERALSNLDNIGHTADVTAILKAQADNDEAQVAASYGVIQGVVWAIPVLGFIGTVLGLGRAIGAFGVTLQQEGNFEGIKQSLTSVTSGLATAFDTTLLALVLALIVQLLVSLVQSKESNWLDSCNEYCSRKIAGRLRLRGDQEE